MKNNLFRNGFVYAFFGIFLLGVLPAIAQKSEFRFPTFELISTKQGLSNNTGYLTLQDSRGFLWFATSYGLNRYDGYNFKVYNYDIADTNSISPSWYYGMVEDKNGIIWIASNAQGFFSFDPRTEKFTRYYHQPGNPNSLSGDINGGNLAMDTSGILWICTSNGLNSYDPVHHKFELFAHRDGDSTSLSADHVVWLCLDDENNVWVITMTDQLEVFNTVTKKVIARYSIGEEIPGNKEKKSLWAVSKGENGNIWLGSEFNGLYRYNTKSKLWKQFRYEPGNEFSYQDSGAFYCLEDTSGNLMAVPIRQGMFFYEAKSGKFFFNKVAESNMAGANIMSMTRDRSGKTWLACNNNGIFTFDPQNKNIKVVRSKQGNDNTVQSFFAVGFYPAGKNEVYVSGGNGVYVFDKLHDKIAPFKLFENGKNIFEDTWTWMFRPDNKGTLWMCTSDGLIYYNPRTREHRYYKHSENDSTSLSAPNATSFVIDNNGKYWVTTFGGGLDLLDPETGKFKAYKAHSGPNSISSNYLSGSLKDSKGLIYLGTWYGGLMQFNPADGTFKIFKHDQKDESSLSCDITWPLYEDKNGFIWIGTIGGGLNVFDPASGKFRAFTEKEGLPSNAVLSLVNDNLGNSWIGTYNGISRFTMPQNPFDKNCKLNFRNYDMSDGLPSTDLYFLGAYKDPDGTLFFATSNAGFFYFNPDELKDNTFVPPVCITSFSLMNKEISEKDSGSVLKVAIEFTKEIVLNYKQNILSFTYAALNFIHPEKNKYAYMMEGYDKDWIYTDASRRFATYTNLDPGDYVFKVKGSNNDGVWNNVPAEIRIRITPPFWQTAWFKLLVALFLAGAAYSFYRYRIGQILILQRIRNKIAADLHDDIGSTLNSISVYSEVAKKDSSRREHALTMIGESSRKIIESLSDIVWSINPENDNFDKILSRMRTLAYNVLKAKKIDCNFRTDENLHDVKLPMDIRRNFYLIYKEALNNLVKYSQATRASVLVSFENKTVTMILRDDGIGFDHTVSYNGNGLSNMRRRAQEINGKLTIDSSVGKGTSIELNLPL